MKQYQLNTLWITALLLAAPGIISAQQLAAVPSGPPPAEHAAGLPGHHPGPPQLKPGKDKMQGPEPGLQKLTTINGKFVKAVANDRFEYDGFLLQTASGELLVKFPPHLGEQLLGRNQEGSSVQVTGILHINPQGKNELQLVSADLNGRRITDQPPLTLKADAIQQQQEAVTSTIKSLRRTPKNEVSGLMLASGQVVNIPPHIGRQLADQLKAGEKITVNGFAEPKRTGVVYSENVAFINAQIITLSGQAYLVK